MNKSFLAIVFIFCFVQHAAASDTTVYIFPNLKFSYDNRNWVAPAWSQFDKNFRSYIELTGNDGSSRKLSVFLTTFYTAAIRKDFEQYHENSKKYELKNGTVSYLNNFLFATRKVEYSKSYVAFYCNGFYIDSSRKILVAASGSPADSARLVEDVSTIIKTLKIIPSEQMDRELGLPISKKRLDSVVTIHNKYLDEISYGYYISNIDRYRSSTTKEILIKEIKEEHAKAYAVSSWGSLPALEALSFDSLLHIRHRYYHYNYYNGDEKLKLVPGLYPPNFSVKKYYQHVKDITRGNYSLNDVLYKESGWPVTIDNVLYPVANYYGGFNTDSVWVHHAKLINKFFPGEQVDRVFFGGSGKNSVTAEVSFKNAANSEDRGWVYFTLQNGKWKSRVTGRPVFDRKAYSISDEIDVDNYRLRALYNKKNQIGGRFFAGGFIKLKDGADQNWTSIKLVKALPGKYKVVFQYQSSNLTNVIANKEQYEKFDVFSEYQPSLIIPNDMAIEVAPEGKGETMEEVLQKEKNKLRSLRYFAEHAGADQRIYVCEYDLFDVNNDGIKDIVSYTVSAGKLVELHIYTIANKSIKEISAASFADVIKKSPVCQFLLQQSLQQKHSID